MLFSEILFSFLVPPLPRATTPSKTDIIRTGFKFLFCISRALQILRSVQSKVPKVFNPVYDDSVVKEWTKDKIDDGINHLNGVKPRLEELRKIASGKEEKQEKSTVKEKS